MNGSTRMCSFLTICVSAAAILFVLGLASADAGPYPCLGGVDNFCLYGPSYPGAPMTHPGGYCDPNGDANFSDADWVRGYNEYQQYCSGGGNGGDKPDVYIEDLWWTPSNPQPGQDVQLYVRVRNGGNAATGADVGVGYFVDGRYVGWGIRGSMGAGTTSSEFGMHQRWTATGGTHQITALVDDINRFEESNENNNSRAENLNVGGGSAKPDVYIEDLWWTPSNPVAGQQVQLHVRVRNGGNAATGADVGVGYFVDGQYVGWGIRGPMAGGETSSAFGMAQRWTAAGGTHQITALVDDINRFEESNENNNSRAENLNVGGGSAKPDVYIEDLWWTPGNPVAGQDVQLYVRVRNGGNAATGADVGVGYFVDGQYVGWGIRGPMAAGETSSAFGMAQRWTAAGGTHQITALVDDINRFAESNENNNSHSENLDVGGGSALPDVYIEDLWWTPSNPAAGQQAQLHVRVRNGGNAATGADVGVGYFVDGQYVGWGIRGPMAGGETSSAFGMAQRWTAAGGTHQITAVVDDINRFAETDENNNSRAESINVSGGSTTIDLLPYLVPQNSNFRVYSRLKKPDGGTADEEFAYRDGSWSNGLRRWFFVKNASGENWEEFAYDSTYIYRNRDTSWANTCQDGAAAYYQVTDQDRTAFARWIKRHMKVGETWRSPVSHYVDAGYKRSNGCRTDTCNSPYEGWVHNKHKLVAHHSTYTTIWGYAVNDVIELGNPDNANADHFFYARGYGLVGFEGPAGNNQGRFISGAYNINPNAGGPPAFQDLCGLMALEARVLSYGEVGRVTMDQPDPDTWQVVSLQNGYLNPVVIMQPPSFNGSQPVTIRLRNVTGTSFEFQLDEWDYLDGAHATETMGYVVLEAGQYTLSGGARVEVGTIEAQHVFETVTFVQSFNQAPVILSQSQTRNGGQPVVSRQQNATTSGFEVRLQEEDGNDGSHAVETIGYIAIEVGTKLGDLPFSAQRTSDAVTHAWHPLEFEVTYSDPVFLAGMQTMDGGDPAGMRYRNLTPGSSQIKVEEEQSGDAETDHTTEIVGYVVFDRPGFLIVEP